MTEEEVFRLKPGDLLRVEADSETSPPYVHSNYAIVVSGAGPNVTVAWKRIPFASGPLMSDHWLTLDDSQPATVLHRSRITRIA